MRLGSALAGSILIGVIVPCFLSWIATYGGESYTVVNGVAVDTTEFQWHFNELFMLMFLALLFCAPGAAILSSILYFIFRKIKAVELDSEGSAIKTGLIVGAFTSVLNFPGFFSYAVLERYPQVGLRIGLLFVVTGATCGAWTAWQTYREAHPERKFLPRFTMMTLLVFALGWGVLLMVFMPKPPVRPVDMTNSMP